MSRATDYVRSFKNLKGENGCGSVQGGSAVN